MPEYNVWVQWTVGTTVVVEADNESEAIATACDIVDMDEGEYLDDSIYAEIEEEIDY